MIEKKIKFKNGICDSEYHTAKIVDKFIDSTNVVSSDFDHSRRTTILSVTKYLIVLEDGKVESILPTQVVEVID